MVNDTGIEYKSLINKIESKIKNYESIGFDMTYYKTGFSTILKNIEILVNESNSKKNINSSNISISKSNYLANDYSKGISLLKSFINDLESNYEVYFIAYNISKYVDIKVTEKVTKEELDKLISKMIYALKSLLNSKVLHYDEEKNVIETCYESAYKLMKYEFLIKGKSDLYEYIKNIDVNSSYINKSIEEDISKIDLNDEKYKSLKKRIYEVQINGTDNTLLDGNIIKLILLYLNNSDLSVNIKKEFDSIEKSIIENEVNLKSNMYETKYALNKVAESKNKLESAKKELKKRVAALTLATSIVVGGGVGLFFPFRKWSTGNEVVKTEITYSELNGYEENKKSFFNEVISDPYENSTIIRAYEPWNKSKRVYEEYDVSNTSFSNLEEYINYNIEDFKVDSISGKDSKDEDDTILYTEPYKEVIMERYNLTGNKKTNILSMICLYFLYCLALLFGATVFNIPLIFSCIELLNCAKEDEEYRNEKYKCHIDDVKEYLNKYMKLINENDELRKRFNEIYEDNKYLLDNPDELIEHVKSLDTINESKALVKKINESTTL